MSVLTQTLLALVCRHLVALMLLTVWHIINEFKKLFALNHFNKLVGWLESRNVVLRDNHCGLLGNILCGLCCAMLDDKASESTKIYRISLSKRLLHATHERFNYYEHCGLLKTGCLRNLVNDVCFCQIYLSIN